MYFLQNMTLPCYNDYICTWWCCLLSFCITVVEKLTCKLSINLILRVLIFCLLDLALLLNDDTFLPMHDFWVIINSVNDYIFVIGTKVVCLVCCESHRNGLVLSFCCTPDYVVEWTCHWLEVSVGHFTYPF